MDLIVKNYLNSFEFDAPQRSENMSVLPIIAGQNIGPEYLTLQEALDNGHLTVTEVDQAGSVPDLKVINNSQFYVLILDGQELVGAKQNRVLNTTVLVDKDTELTIPVSCTEQGRWSYSTEKFSESESFLPRSIQMSKMASVSDSLRRMRSHRSNQSQVWNDINRYHREAGTASPTGAMIDAYRSRENEIEDRLKLFEVSNLHNGCLVFINDEVIGMDVLSRPEAYSKLSKKLLRSYAMEAIRTESQKGGQVDIEKARQFITEAQKCSEERFKSAGLGEDFRFDSQQIIGSALIYIGYIMHTAFFNRGYEHTSDRMASFRHRRDFRR